ncbi:MAG: hypothetical protein ACN6OV_00895, partial [Acinetobacter sp.]|uniref:hypothetical protein n=1 Tax=Acinetobacter sp. TaxID=472 RepID=UPI003CFF6E2E
MIAAAVNTAKPTKSEVIEKFKAIIDILTGQHGFKVIFQDKKYDEEYGQLHVSIEDKNQRDILFLVTDGVQGAGLEYRISTNAYSFSWDIKDSAEQTAQAIADASAEFNKSLLEGSAVKCPYTVEQITASIRNLGKQDAKSMRVAYKTFNQERDDKNIALVEANPEMIDQVYAIFAKEGNQEKMPGHIPELLELEKTTDFPVLLVYNVIRNLDFAKAFSEGAQDLIKQKQLADEAQNTGIKLSAGDFVTGKFANLNKNNSVAEYRDEVEQNAYKESVCIVQKAITLSPEEYDSFANSLLEPNEKIAGLGGTWVDDDQKPREQRNYMSIVVAVMAQGRETLLIDPQQYSYARYVALDPKKVEAPEAFKDVYIDASGEVKDRAEDGNAGGADEITDATDPDQYAKIIDDDARLTEWQDPLDSFFQSRLIETRNALRELGWTGERFKDLSKDGHTLVMDLKQVGGGANVVGVTYSVSDTDFSVRDDLKLDAQALASTIDSAVPVQAAEILSPDELDQLVNEFAKSKGMQESNGYQILGNLSLMSRPAMGDVILLAGNPNEENNGLRESKTIAEVTGNEIFELTAEKLESVFGPLIDQEIERLKAGAPALKPSSYAIKNTNPRARKPRGTITLKPLESDQSGNYEVTIVKDGVGGQFVGTIEEAKNWLIQRLMDMGEAVSDKGYSFADTAQKLDLIIGDDVLGIKTLPENPYQNAALIDLAKGVVKELAALGWEKSGSTVVKTIDVNGEPSRLKFDFNPAKKGKEIWIKNDNGESIGEFAMPELTEIGVKGKAQEMDAFVTEFATS